MVMKIVVAVLLVTTVVAIAILVYSIKEYHEKCREMSERNKLLARKCSGMEQQLALERKQKSPITGDSDGHESIGRSADARLMQELKQQKAQTAEWKKKYDQLLKISGDNAALQQEIAALQKRIKAASVSEERIAALEAELKTAKSELEAQRAAAAAESQSQPHPAQEETKQIQTALEQENDALRKEIEELHRQLDGTEKRRIEQVLNAYLTAMSAADEQELAARFRETAFALMDCSAEEAAKVMRSPVIGTDLNKRLLRNQARRSNRMDIAQII